MFTSRNDAVAEHALISPAAVIAGELPEGATGVHWTDTNWTECRAHLEDASWAIPETTQNTERTGRVLFGAVSCNACAEVAQ